MKTICISTPNVQKEQRVWDVILPQAHSTERAGKPETMQDSENKATTRDAREVIPVRPSRRQVGNFGKASCSRQNPRADQAP
jgi:hypothetical protein